MTACEGGGGVLEPLVNAFNGRPHAHQPARVGGLVGGYTPLLVPAGDLRQPFNPPGTPSICNAARLFDPSLAAAPPGGCSQLAAFSALPYHYCV